MIKKLVIALSCTLLLSAAGISGISNIGVQKAEAASVVGKSYTYYLSKTQVKSLYKSMKAAEKYGGWASILVGLIPEIGVAAGAASGLAASAVAQKEVEKAYFKDMRLKVTYTYGVTMSLNTTTFKAVN